MKLRLLKLGAVSIVIVLVALYLWRRHYASLPILSLPSTVIDLGAGRPGETLTGAISLKNAGGSLLEFSVIKSCGCNEVLPLAGTILPGCEQRLAVSLGLENHSESKKAVSFAIKSNAPNQETVRCTVVARCQSRYSISPHYIDFGSIATKSGDSRIVNINADDEARISSKDWLLTSGSERIDARWNVEGDSAKLKISIRETAPPGSIFDSVVLSHKAGEHLFRIPVRGEVVEPLVAIPSVISIEKGNGSGSTRVMSVLLLAHSRVRDWSSLSVLGDCPCMKIVNIAPISDKRCNVSLEIDPDRARSANACRIRLDDVSAGLSVKYLSPKHNGELRP
jgi:hypothetical protein